MENNKEHVLNFIKDLKRMCETSYNCVGCAFNGKFNKNDCFYYLINNPFEAMGLIEEWNTKHPRKTYKMDFLEKFPNCKTKPDGTPMVCAESIYNVPLDCDGHILCSECWNLEMED